MEMVECDSNTNILLLTVDCFRYDQYEQLDWLEPIPGGQTVFDTCIATGPGTRTAFPGLLTSTYPLEAGGYNVVGSDRTVLAEPLRKIGYDTAGFHSNPNLGRQNGWNMGFETYYDSIEGKRRINENLKSILPERILDFIKSIYLSKINQNELPYKRAEQVNKRASRWIGNQDSPWFCWVHYMDLHHPYIPPDEYRGVDEAEARRLWRLMNDNQDSITDEDVEMLWELYRGEAAYLFDALHSFYRSLLQRGDLENTLVVLTGDHGEEFQEHGTVAHKEKVYDELVRVPLAFAGNPVHGDALIEGVTSTLDIPSTILEEIENDAMGVPSSYRGQNLFASDYQRGGAFSEIAHTQFTNISSENLVVSYRTNEWKYILDRQRDRTELYDLKSDPEETENLSSSDPSVKSELHEHVRTHINKHLDDHFQAEPDVGADIEQRLSDLGYT